MDADEAVLSPEEFLKLRAEHADLEPEKRVRIDPDTILKILRLAILVFGIDAAGRDLGAIARRISGTLESGEGRS